MHFRDKFLPDNLSKSKKHPYTFSAKSVGMLNFFSESDIFSAIAVICTANAGFCFIPGRHRNDGSRQSTSA